MNNSMLLVLPLVVVVMSSLAHPVSAHTLRTDRAVGVTIHIDPDDAPVANKEAKLLVDIQDKTGRFNPNNPGACDCILIIGKGGNALKTMPVVSGGGYAQLRYMFPSSGLYFIQVTGAPNGTGAVFQSFSVRFDYYVKPGNQEIEPASFENPLMSAFPFVASGVGTIIIVMFVVPIKHKPKRI